MLQTIRPELLSISAEQIQALMPFLWIIGGGIIAIFAAVIRKAWSRWVVFTVSVSSCTIAALSSVELMQAPTVKLFNGMMILDPYAYFLSAVVLACAVLTLMSSFKYLDDEGIHYPEYHILILFSTVGMMIMMSALDFIVLFIGLEIMSLCVYSLVAFRRADRKCNEASLKYFITGGAASAILLYGVALLYGSTGSIQIEKILAHFQAHTGQLSPIFVIGAWFVLLGFLIKVAAVPFHMWMPDVYEGAPSPVTGFMTTALKLASFATFVRVFLMLGFGKGLNPELDVQIHDILWVCAVLTMIVGNMIALSQTNLKRMLGYSSIAHTGYLLVGLIVGPKEGFGPVVLYLVIYSIMNLGAFVVLSMLARDNDEGLNLGDLSGISQKRPALAFTLAIFMLSMAGIPPTAGFIGKYYLFFGAIRAGEIPLVVISVLCSAISVYYYLRVLVYLYMREPVGAGRVGSRSVLAMAALASLAVMTIQFGIFAGPLVRLTKTVVAGF